MNIEQRVKVIKITTVVTFLVMIIVNSLANILPINGMSTGQLSDSYVNLFAPAGVTFAIWGLIYLLLGGYTLFQLNIIPGIVTTNRTELITKIGILFSVSSIVNASWIFAWHYQIIPLSMLLMIIILVCLIMINQLTRTKKFSTTEYFFIRLPFSIYFGWITVATIANAAVLLVSLGWKDFILNDATWTVIVIAIGLAIALATILKNRDVAYGFVIVWAYSGIVLKHTSPEGFGSQYPVIINATIACIALLLIVEAYLLISNRGISSK